MSVSGPFGIGNSWAGVYRTEWPSLRPAGALSVNTSTPTITSDTAREILREATSAVRAAFGAFTRETSPTYVLSIANAGATPATFTGISARVTPVDETYSYLQTTSGINTQTSTIRSSSAALGLDVDEASRLESSSGLGLDVTSAQTVSSLASSGTLGLDVSSPQTASHVTSTAELSTAPSSYGSSSLTFTKGAATSTSTGTLTGTYTGTGAAAGATSLTVESNGTAALNAVTAVRVRFDVKDQTGATLFNFDGNLKAGDAVNLGSDIGLSISFSTGTLTDNHTASTTVSNQPVTVDANAAFNAAAASRPQFDGGAVVTAGSFTVNGTSVTVNANDTINTVLSRINSSGAGVTASLASDRITLTTNGNSEDDIVVSNDTSGFLSATQLSGATTAKGNVRDDQQVLAKTTQFASVTSGSFTINGVAIAVNKDTDTVSSVVSRINGAGAGVTASYDSAQDKVVLTSASNSEDLITVAGDTTGFAAAASLSTVNTVKGNIRDDQQVLAKTTQFATVSTGSFSVNGVSISVDKDTDSLTSIIDRISGAGAGVTASFNATSNKIELVTTSDSDDLITVANDTSGFLTAAHLSTGNTIRGSAFGEDHQLLSAAAHFAGVTNGSFSVNGVSISVNTGTDSLDTVLNRINSSGAGVTASYDRDADKVAITPDVAGATLDISGDTSGFLSAAGIATGVEATRVNAGGAFNASGANGPLFDPGLTVQAGSFSVNGVSIAVAANDTVNSVLAKITGSSAGVTATFDAASETIRLTSTSATPDLITLGADTSGFLAAVKLDGTAQGAAGSTQALPYDSALGAISDYSGVQAGTITVNGHQIAIDPSTTTVRGLVSALNNLPDLAATLNDTTGQILVSARQPNSAITVSDTSGVLSTLGIADGTYTKAAGVATTVQSQTGLEANSNAREVAARVSAALRELNEAVSRIAQGHDDPEFQNELRTNIEEAIESLKKAGAQGLSVAAHAAGLRLSVDRNSLEKSIEEHGHRVDFAAVAEKALGELAEKVAARLEPQPAAAPPIARHITIGGDPTRAQLTADQAQTALLLLRPQLKGQGQTQDASAMKAAKAYSEKNNGAGDTEGPFGFEIAHNLGSQIPDSRTGPFVMPAITEQRTSDARPPKLDRPLAPVKSIADGDRPPLRSSFDTIVQDADKRRKRDDAQTPHKGSKPKARVLGSGLRKPGSGKLR